jgi:tRNA threonylcarbamoyladenosine biosynthesis protein TsaB
MIVLGLDSGGRGIGVALVDGTRPIARRYEAMDQGHAARLVPLVQALLAEAGIGFPDIALYGVTIGPGSFTGLRVGLAAVAGMALATGCGIVGISRFDAVRAACDPAWDDRPLIVALDGRRPEPFVAIFGPDGTPWAAPGCFPAAAVARMAPPGPVIVAGDGAHLLSAAFGDRATVAGTDPIDPLHVAHLAFDRRAEARTGPPPPFYLRPPDAVAAPPFRPAVTP